MKGGDHIWKVAGVAPRHVYWRAILKIARSALQHEGQVSFGRRQCCTTLGLLAGFSKDSMERVATWRPRITFGKRRVLHHVASTGGLF